MKTLNKTISIILLGLCLMACGGNSANVNSNLANANTTTANVVNTANNAPANNANVTTNSPTNIANANKPANATVTKPAENGPKRIAFAKDKSEGSENITLAAGESKQFVVGAKSGQIFMADADSKDLEITMVKGKDAAQMKEPGHYDSTLVADGDFVFQVRNTSKKEVKSSLKVIISHTGISNR